MTTSVAGHCLVFAGQCLFYFGIGYDAYEVVMDFGYRCYWTSVEPFVVVMSMMRPTLPLECVVTNMKYWPQTPLDLPIAYQLSGVESGCAHRDRTGHPLISR